jgi:hypothetical protein
MELYVNPTITGFRQDVDGTIKELKIGSDKEDAYANIIEQGASAKLDNNKAATINVSTYTEPVVITPTSGKDGMKKATVTLSNIPSGSVTLYCWKSASVNTDVCYTTTQTPTTSDKVLLSEDNTMVMGLHPILSVTEEGLIISEGAEPAVYARYSDGDISLT